MSRLYDQIDETTKFLLDRSMPDIESLYVDLVDQRTPRLVCFQERKINLDTMRVSIEVIGPQSFRNVVLFMGKIGLINLTPLEIRSDHRVTLREYSPQVFSELLRQLLHEFIDIYDITVKDLRNGIINKITYPRLRNVTTIHQELTAFQDERGKQTPGLQELNKVLTLYSDLQELERRSPTLYF